MNINGITNIPLPGQLWPEQGGIFDGILIGDDGRAYLQISAERGSEGDFESEVLGCYGEEITNASSERDGLANTDSWAAAGSDIAKKVRELKLNGFDDWHIPARHQARLAYLNSAPHFDTDDWYWTSTQYSAHNAWYQYFFDGSQLSGDEDYTGRVRVVRSLPIQ